ncbi:hypothetical protein ACFB49_30540 [Sphingomonas sp. DBB INV C78]
MRCVSCDRRLSREELIRENGEVIETEIDDLKAAVLKDVKTQFRDTLLNAFKGSQNIRIK